MSKTGKLIIGYGRFSKGGGGGLGVGEKCQRRSLGWGRGRHVYNSYERERNVELHEMDQGGMGYTWEMQRVEDRGVEQMSGQEKGGIYVYNMGLT